MAITPNTASTLPAADSALAPLTRTDTSASLTTTVLFSDTSRPNVLEDVDLDGFFGASSIPGKSKQRNASPGPSAQPLPSAVREFIDNVDLPETLPNDRRFDGKVETRGWGRGVTSLTQNTAQFYGEFRQNKDRSMVNEMAGLQHQMVEIDYSVAALRAEADERQLAINQRQSAIDARLAEIERSATHSSAQIDSVFNAVQTLLQRLPPQRDNSAAQVVAPPPVAVGAPPLYPGTPLVIPTIAVPTPAPPFLPLSASAPAPPAAPAPAPLPSVSSSADSMDGRMERLEAPVHEVVSSAKRARSPSTADVMRTIRPRLDMLDFNPNAGLPGSTQRTAFGL
ncbi:hypothetical protein MVEN_02320200 [Mycena venus]|uniref:Uncharacterized protein n=1 Tax=Mycena venus TaxID=2733690 RepID=A0A8H6X466_9AGAR|nr:hypothetical protein MVEN_02320200 [Mycena venus]